MLQSRTISAPIPVPGTQLVPTTPSFGSTTSTTIIQINSNNSSDLHKNNSNGGARITTTTIGTSSPLGLGSNNHLSSSSSIHGSRDGSSSKDGWKDSNNPGGLRRFSSLGNTRKLHVENSTLRAKITELEHYLQGLKEELILAHRQIHAKNLEAKVAQDRKAVEIHELGQHIQRCEFEMLAKTAECEALQNKLQYQTKEQVSKLKHINMLETELMDYRRMSIMSGHSPASATGTGPGMIGPGGVMVARGGSVLSRNSRNSSDLSESVRSSTILQDNAAAVEEATAALQAQVKQLKDEQWKKDEQIQEMSEKIQFLTDCVSQLEKVASVATAVVKEDDAKSNMTPTTSMTDKNNIVSGSTSNASFNTATTGGVGAISSRASHSSSSVSIVNSVGYDLTVEHPKLLSRYQALRAQHAQASEYLDQLESENQDLKVQLLDVSESVVGAADRSLDTVTPTAESPEPITTFSASSLAIKEEEQQTKEVEEVKEVEETTAPAVAEIALAVVAAITPSISRNSFHHPAASNLAPLDTIAVNANNNAEKTTEPTATSAVSSNDDEGSSPTSAATSSSSPSTVVAVSTLTRKSSLRYSRDGQVSPTLNATATTNAL
ncbi:hypothetical protein K457DRAFT_129965 [Linnemannia elongata AG-77]|uniref:Uncharacterized protein n=1 Tax=Linnemannia elongata AG-77 TaxID=1314771 RepID=A0A197JG87_9FUNG|nr:hypothetical protein K457DRAFT_129965 [Linnemannia elongata AG-77]